jgi:hypothetical protein
MSHWKSGHDRAKNGHDLDRGMDHDQSHQCHVQRIHDRERLL